MSSIRIGLLGYGNLGRGVELACAANPDTELVAVFTRRDPSALEIRTPGATVYSAADLAEHVDDVDVLVLAGGSATDLPEQTPAAARLFNVVDSFDTHANIPAHFAAVDAAAHEGGKVAVISVGWDPGMFSVSRLYANAILPNGADYTFWGRGVSQGHSDAIRRIPGVVDARQYTVPVPAALDAVRAGEMPELSTREKHTRECFVVDAIRRIPGVVDARQYTVPVPAALDAVRAGEMPELSTREKHTRECFVVVEEGADKAAIEQAIVTMPNYFADYDTTVTFITEEELQRDHAGIPHGGSVIRTGATGVAGENKHVIEYSLTLDSNPEFTGSVLVAFARAAYRLSCEGSVGCKTIFDIAPAYLSPESGESLRAHML